MNHAEMIVCWLKLTRVRGLGPKRMQALFESFGTLGSIISATSSELVQTRIFTEEMSKEWEKLKMASSDSFLGVIAQCKQNNIKIVPIFDERYPEKLKQMPYPPLRYSSRVICLFSRVKT